MVKVVAVAQQHTGQKGFTYRTKGRQQIGQKDDNKLEYAKDSRINEAT